MPSAFLPSLSSMLVALALLPVAATATDLTAQELRWLKAGAPAIAYAKQMKLPVDIVVQPQAGPNDVPLAMGFMDGRCKLVLTLRGNPTAEDVLHTLPEHGRDLMIEAMTAHELGHCWRYAQNDWHVLPTGFVEKDADLPADAQLAQLSRELRETRREEAYADLVALAWIQRSRPADYAAVYGWLRQLRDAQPASHLSHDTRTWLGLARDGAVFAGAASSFEQARTVWSHGLQPDDVVMMVQAQR